MKRQGLVLLALGLIAVLAGASSSIALAQSPGIEVRSVTVDNKFPQGLLFKVSASAPKAIKSITLMYQTTGSKVTQYGVFKFDPAADVTTEFLLRTSVGGENSRSFTPPGTDFTYRLRVEDAAESRLETEPKTATYMDNRFPWEAVSKGLITVYYYGPVKSRAELILDIVTKTEEKMGDILGAHTTRPIRVLVWNNYRDMVVALPFVSQATRSGLITEGQAYGEEGILLLYGGDPNIRGVTSHEMTHLVVHQAADGAASFIPAWLNEGLAEYGNIDPGTVYDEALNKGLREGRLLPIRSMTTQPGDPDDVIMFYGQSRSIVRLMINTLGKGKMQNLLSLIKEGKTIDDALMGAYGFDRVGLDNLWRKSVGAPPLPAQAATTPTPRAIPTFVPFGAETTPIAQAPASAAPTPVKELATPAATEKTPSRSRGLACNPPASASALPDNWDLTLLPILMVPLAAMILARRPKK